MRARLVGLFLLGALCGCEPAQSAPRVEHSEYEGEADYGRGLSEVLVDSPSEYATAWLTISYNLAYATGRGEGFKAQVAQEEVNEQTGCLAIAPVVASVHPQFEGHVACGNPEDAPSSDAKFRGKDYAHGRLLMARKGAEGGDSRAADQLVTAFDRGYLMGFSHVMPDDTSETARRAAVSFGRGCRRLVNREHGREPFSDDALVDMLRRCELFAAEHGRNMLGELAKRRQE